MSRSRKDEEVKTPSARLRSVFYLLWTKDKQGHGDFEDFYDDKMEMLIEHYKNILKKVSK